MSKLKSPIIPLSNSRTLSSVFLDAISGKATSPPTDSKVLVADSLRRASALSENLVPQLRGGDRVSDTSKSCNSKPAKININKSVEDVYNLPLFNTEPSTDSSCQKHKSCSRKGRWISNNTSKYYFDDLIRLCANKLGTESVIPVFGNLRRETGLKEYNALIGICVEKAARSSCNTDEIRTREIDSAFKILHSMLEQGFQLEEETYGMLLRFFIDKHMVEEFQRLSVTVKIENPASVLRLAFYEILLWNKVNNREKIQELFGQISLQNDKYKFPILENYLLAACESDMKKEILQLLDIVDITRVSSIDHLEIVFKSLGRHFFQPIVENLSLSLKTSGREESDISNLIFEYVINIPNLSVEDVILNFNNLHEKVEISPHYSSIEKLVKHFCNLQKVHTALSLINSMSYSASELSTGTLNALLDSCADACEFHLAYPIYKTILDFGMKANSETFLALIDMNVRTKNFDNAHSILHNLKNMNLAATRSMYNAILAGYFREKRVPDALNVVKEMGNVNLNPDSQTYSYLIANCTSINDITKYRDEIVNLGVHFTKHVSMALINAYTTCGHFEQAKQVVEEAPGQNLNDLRNVLMSALACNGRTPEALSLYRDIKLSGCHTDPKSILSVIDNSINSGEDVGVLLELLGEVEGSKYWVGGCGNIAMYCVRGGHFTQAVNMFKMLKDSTSDELSRDAMFDEAFSQLVEAEEVDVKFGMDLLRVVKEDLQLRPSRKSLDFLLAACVKAKDVQNSTFVWKEYENAGLPYNIMTYTRMYQALLVAGDHKAADRLIQEMTMDDRHVRILLKSFREAYVD